MCRTMLGLAAVMLLSVEARASDLLANCTPQSPTGCVTKLNPGRVQSGYTYIDSSIDQTHGLPNKAYLIDAQGNLVHTWDVGAFGKPLPNGHVLGGLPFPERAGGFVGSFLDCLFELDWDNNVVWPPNGATLIGPNGGRFCDPNGQIITLNTDTLAGDPGFGRNVTWQHHDVQRPGSPVGYWAPSQTPEVGGGKTLILALDLPPLGETSQISNFALYSDKIDEVEVDSQGTHVLWEWRAHEHFAPNGSNLGYGFEGIGAQALKTIRVNLGNPQQGNRTDWLHVNDAAYLGPNRFCRNPNLARCDQRFHPENIIFTSRNANFLAIIARHDDPQGAFRSGDIVWRVGPTFNNGSGKLQQIVGPHHAHMIPDQLNGGGNIMVFDNGGTGGFGADANGNPTYPSESRTYSRVIEFDPIALDVVWSYERPDPNNVLPGENFAPFRSDNQSSAQRLVNHNTLITEAFSGRVFEVTEDGELVWEFVSPFGPNAPYGDPSQRLTKPGNAVYRAYRVPEDWVAPFVHRH